MKNDITSRDDIKLLVDSFYAKVQQDDFIGPVPDTCHITGQKPT
jgi:truncated hemoglobin YjbI